MKIPAQYKHRVKEAYQYEDGFQIVLEKSWRCPDGYVGEKKQFMKTQQKSVLQY